MEEEELLKTWADKLFADLFESETPRTDEGLRKTITEHLKSVFLVGIETGRDNEKLQRQLETLGKPHGNVA